MAERKSVNKYYPPDWDPSKGSVNNYVGQHPLRDRARKLSQGILIIRFEMPYNIWCDGCKNHIGMGVRYNAEKTKTGMYYSTPIYKFRMKCHLCPNHFEIQTDPKNHDYVILEGARRKEQRWDPKENEQIVPEDRATHKKMATDAMFKLEHGSDDKKKGKAVVMTLSSLEGRRDEWKDDYILNKIARQKFREEKKTLKTAEESDAALLSKSSLDIHLVEESEQDKRLAYLMKYRTVESYDEKQAQKRKEIESRPIFQPSKVQKLDTSPATNKKLTIIRKHLQSVGNKKESPFNAEKMKTSLKSTIGKVSLGIRRKSLINPANQTEKELNVTTDSCVDIRQESYDMIKDDSRTREASSTEVKETYINSTNKTSDKACTAEVVESISTTSSDRNDNVNSSDVDNMNVELENCDNCNSGNYQQLDKEAKQFSKSFIRSCWEDIEPDVLNSDHLYPEIKFCADHINENDFEAHGKESKPSCDNKTCKALEAENCDTFCDKLDTDDVSSRVTKVDTENDSETNPETKVDAKNISLVALYSDSDSESSSADGD